MLRSIKNEKSPGPEDVSSEILKCAGAALQEILVEYVQHVWEGEEVPQAWKNLNIIIIYKNNSERSECGNRRNISLLSHVGKLLTKFMLKSTGRCCGSC